MVDAAGIMDATSDTEAMKAEACATDSHVVTTDAADTSEMEAGATMATTETMEMEIMTMETTATTEMETMEMETMEMATTATTAMASATAITAMAMEAV